MTLQVVTTLGGECLIKTESANHLSIHVALLLSLLIALCHTTAQQDLCHALKNHASIPILVQATVDHVFHLGMALGHNIAAWSCWSCWLGHGGSQLAKIDHIQSQQSRESRMSFPHIQSKHILFAKHVEKTRL